MSDLIEDCRALLSNELQAKDDEIEGLQARVAELEDHCDMARKMGMSDQ